jgi:hypothetical protein
MNFSDWYSFIEAIEGVAVALMILVISFLPCQQR